MRRRGFLGRLLGGVAAAAAAVKLAPKVQGHLMWNLPSKFVSKPAEKIFFRGVELVPDDFEPLFYLPKGHDRRMMDLITDKLAEGQAVMDREREKHTREFFNA